VVCHFNINYQSVMKTTAKTKSSVIVGNLRAWRALATPEDINAGNIWYNEAHQVAQEISTIIGGTVWQGAAVISALSPMNTWEGNKHNAIELAKCWALGGAISDVSVSTFNANKRKAWEILNNNTKALNQESRKTWSFAKTIELKERAQCVVIDRWHLRACLTRSKTRRDQLGESVGIPQYDRIERLTMAEASKLGEAPCVYQAIIWCTIKTNWEK
jgi:hypothetical protein